MSDTPTGFTEVARAWVEHLRRGGSTPWATWVRQPHEPAPVRGTLPGAAELELVRRLAGRSALPVGAFTGLADVVFGRSGPGRGLPQLPLPWYGDAPPGHAEPPRPGAPPTDPADVPAAELVRVATGVLAELLLGGPLTETPTGPLLGPTSGPPRRRPRRRPWSRAFRLLGAPVSTADVRAWLAAGGHVEGGRRPEVVLLAAPFEAHLAQIWTARVQRGAPVRWEAFVGRWARSGDLPPALRLPSLARRWAARVGPGHVHVVVASEQVAVRRTVGDLLGVRGRDAVPELRDLSPAATELLRRLNPVLSVRAEPDRAAAARHRAALLLHRGRSVPPALPRRHREWAAATAASLAEELRAGGYAVHGDLLGVTARPGTGRTRPRHRAVLDLALDACLDLAARAPRRQEAQ